MSFRNILEEFPETKRPSGETDEVLAAQLEAARVAGYEEGYRLGWDDAVAEERKRRGHIDAEFERCIQDLGFTYHEAVDQVRTELTGFLSEMTDALFPSTIPDLLREAFRSEAVTLAEGLLNPSIKLLASENVIAQLQEMMPEVDIDVSVETEPSLGPHQAYLTLAGQERVIDFQPLVDALREQLSAAGQDAKKEALDE